MKSQIKYAPTNLNEVIYPNVTVQRRIHGYATGQLEGHMILHGPNGTGKTTLAGLLVKAIGGEDAMLETNEHEELLDKRDIRGYLRQAASLARLTTSRKYFILLNEFDTAKKRLSQFWNALDACSYGVMVIITTNKPMAIDPSIRSRCDLVGMPAISASAALARVQFILQAEGLQLDSAQVLEYLRSREHWGDLRKYFGLTAELLYLQRNELPFPPWRSAPRTLKVI
jgi:replication-associated recombination protein RarA